MKAVVLPGRSKAAYLSAQKRVRKAMFFKRGNDTEFVKAGSLFRRTRSDRMIETAKVLSIASDSFGIPHVRYEVSFEKPRAMQRVTDGPRVLALTTFADTYCERVGT